MNMIRQFVDAIGSITLTDVAVRMVLATLIGLIIRALPGITTPWAISVVVAGAVLSIVVEVILRSRRIREKTI